MNKGMWGTSFVDFRLADTLNSYCEAKSNPEMVKLRSYHFITKNSYTIIPPEKLA